MLTEIALYGATATALTVCVGQWLRMKRTTEELQRARQWYEDQCDTMASATDLCGGCGKLVTHDQIKVCLDLAEQCPNYKATKPQRKINIGYQGHLHTDRN